MDVPCMHHIIDLDLSSVFYHRPLQFVLKLKLKYHVTILKKMSL